MRKPKFIQPAFPNPYQEGMSLRDHFAAKALPTLIGRLPDDTAEKIAADAYAIANALMQRRETV